jgi:hypothetical protein
MASFVWQSKNIEHIAAHGVSPDEAEHVVVHARSPCDGTAAPREAAIPQEKEMKRNSNARNWPQLSLKDLAEATREFDDPNYLPPARKMPAALAARHAKALAALRAKARTGSKRTQAQRHARVQVTLEPKLLRRADARAAEEGLSRSQLSARGLQLLLGS